MVGPVQQVLPPGDRLQVIDDAHQKVEQRQRTTAPCVRMGTRMHACLYLGLRGVIGRTIGVESGVESRGRRGGERRRRGEVRGGSCICMRMRVHMRMCKPAASTAPLVLALGVLAFLVGVEGGSGGVSGPPGLGVARVKREGASHRGMLEPRAGEGEGRSGERAGVARGEEQREERRGGGRGRGLRSGFRAQVWSRVDRCTCQVQGTGYRVRAQVWSRVDSVEEPTLRLAWLTEPLSH